MANDYFRFELSMKRSFNLKEVHYRWIGIVLLSLFAELLGPDDHMIQYPLWYRLFGSFVFTSVYWNGAVIIFNFFRKKLPNIQQTTLRILLTFLSMFIWILIGGIPPKLLLGVCTFDDLNQISTYTEFMAFSGIASLLIGTIYESVFYFDKWKLAIRQNEQLKNQQVRTQFEVLQNQMSPHFLFNSLNTLTTLIAEDSNVAIEFTQKLSDVYRYILQNKDRELVTLEEELHFVKDYLFLLKMRYPDNLHSIFDIAPAHLTQYIAPLTLQILIENAIKHNVVSKSHPLTINVYVNNGQSIVVSNKIKPKQALEKSTQTGLMNIKKRYEYLGGRQIDIIRTADKFMVAIPLISLTIEEKSSLTPLEPSLI